jgi:transcriptional regulator with XRE-family HTH domain
MTTPDRMELLKNKCRELGQAEVARRIGKSDSAISQVLSGKYKGDPAIILQLVEEVFGGTIVQCPVLGPITLGRCAQERKKPFAATNPVRIRLYKACRECKGGQKQ